MPCTVHPIHFELILICLSVNLLCTSNLAKKHFSNDQKQLLLQNKIKVDPARLLHAIEQCNEDTRCFGSSANSIEPFLEAFSRLKTSLEIETQKTLAILCAESSMQLLEK